MKTFKQCRLRCGDEYTVSWIPSPYAKIGHQIEFVDLGKFFTVEEVFQTEQPEEWIKSREQDVRKGFASIR